MGEVLAVCHLFVGLHTCLLCVQLALLNLTETLFGAMLPAGVRPRGEGEQGLGAHGVVLLRRAVLCGVPTGSDAWVWICANSANWHCLIDKLTCCWCIF